MAATRLDQDIRFGVCPHDCYDTCGLRITVADQQIQRVEGDPTHPITNGFLCFKVNRYLDRLQHPDRILHPLRRVGPKGQGQFVRATWDEALSDIAERLHAVRRTWGGAAILPYSFAGNMGVLASESMDRRFFSALGASQLDRTICTATAGAVARWMFGQSLGPDPETMPQARLIVLWGANPVATSVHAVPLLDAARRAGGRVITIDPLATATARRFDEHVQLAPNQDAALALGIGRRLIDQGAVDQDFIQQRTTGFAAYEAATRPWTLKATAAATGLEPRVIARLADAMASARPLLLRAGYGVQRQTASGRATWAIAALAVITGAMMDVGGGFLQGNGDAFPLNTRRLHAADLGEPAPRVINMVELGHALTQLKDPPIQALVVYNSNPAATAPHQAAVLRGLAREDLLTVVHEQMPTDTARWADWVLPAAMSWEVLDLHVSYWHRYVQLNRPAVPPPGEAVSNPELFRRLARAMGLNDPRLAASDEALLDDVLAPDPPHPWLSGITRESLERQPMQKLRLAADARPFVDTPIPTSDGRIHLAPPPLAAAAPDPDAARPFHLLTPSRRETIKSTFGNVARIQPQEPPTLLMAPADAASLALVDGAAVRVHNSRGATVLTVKTSEIPRPGTVVSYAVRWNDAGHGTNVNQLTSAALSDFGGGATFYSTRVSVTPIG